MSLCSDLVFRGNSDKSWYLEKGVIAVSTTLVRMILISIKDILGDKTLQVWLLDILGFQKKYKMLINLETMSKDIS